MKTRLYSFKSFKPELMISLLNQEGITLTVIAKSTGISVRTLNDWKMQKHRPYNRIMSDKLVEYGIRHLVVDELDKCGVYP